MKKPIYIKALAMLFLVLVIVSCDQDDSVPNIPRDNSTTAVISEDAISVSEGNSTVFTIVQESLVEPKEDNLELGGLRSGQIGVRVIGGTAVEGEDYTFNIPLIPDVSPFLLQDGRYYDYDASIELQHVVNDIITTVVDNQSEGSETIELEFFPVGLAAVIIDDRLTVTITD